MNAFLKVFTFLVVLQICLASSGVFIGDDDQTNVGDPTTELFKKFFAKLPRALRKGYPKSNIPSHDPWKKSGILTEYSTYYPSYRYLHINYRDLVLTGISKFKIDYFFIKSDYSDPGEIYVNYMAITKNLRLKGNLEGSDFQKSPSSRIDFNGTFEFSGTAYVRNATYAAQILNGRYVLTAATENWNNLFEMKSTLNMAPGITNDYFKQNLGSVFDFLEKYELSDQLSVANELLSRLQSGNELSADED